MSLLIKEFKNQTFYQNIDFSRFSQYTNDPNQPMDYMEKYRTQSPAQQSGAVSNLNIKTPGMGTPQTSWKNSLQSSQELVSNKKNMNNIASQANIKSKNVSSISGNTKTPSTIKNGGMSSSSIGMAGNILGSVTEVGDVISEKKGINAPTTSTQDMRNKGMDTANKAMMSSGMPILMAVGAVNWAIDKTGGYSNATSRDSELNDNNNLSGWTNAGNIAASFLTPGAGYFLKKTKTYDVSGDLASSSGFTGAAADARAVKNNFSGKKLSLGAGKANRIIERAKNIDLQVQNTLKANRDIMSASNSFDLRYKNQLEGGYSQSNSVKFGKEGIKLNLKNKINLSKNVKRKKEEIFTIKIPKNNIKKIQISNIELEQLKLNIPIEIGKLFVNLIFEEKKNITELKNGGTINIIPGGTLHAHKHHLEDVSDIYKDITTKGMPVVVYAEDGTPKQTAEIETSEVILHIKLTEILEKLKKENSEESQLEAGKILAKELIKNTINYSKEYTDTLKTKKLKQNNEIHL